MLSQFPLISVNGVLNASISPLDRGFSYGDGVFETCLYRAGDIPLWRFHRERLLSACESLMIPLDIGCLDHELEAILQKARYVGAVEGVVKLIVTRGVGGRGYVLPEQVLPTRCILFFNETPNPLSDLRLRICKQRLSHNQTLAGIKHLNRLEQVMARAEWCGADYDEGLMLDENNRIIEATASNFFIVKDGGLVTPDLHRVGVAGIMRRVIIEHLAPALALPITVRHIDVAELSHADEIFLCNSVRGIMPVAFIDGESPLHVERRDITDSLQEHLTLLYVESVRQSHEGGA